MRKRHAAHLALIGFSFAWPLAGLVKELPTTLAAQAGIAGLVGVPLAIAFWKTEPLPTLGALTSLLVGVAGFQADQGSTVGAIVLVWLGLSMAYLPRERSVRTLSEALRVFESAALPALVSLVIAAASTYALRRGLGVGLARIEVHDWLWNPQFTMPLWVGFGALLMTVIPSWTALGLVSVSVFSSILVLIIRRPHVEEAPFAFLATMAAVTLQMLVYRLPLKRRGAATGAHGLALSICSASAGYVLTALRAHDVAAPAVPAIWRYHALVGCLAGCAAGLYRETRRSASQGTPLPGTNTMVASDSADT